MEDAFLVAAARTPLGSFQGALSSVAATQLGSIAIAAALERSRADRARIDAVYMGNVLSAGLGQAPARQAAKGAGIPDAVPATTVSKVCGSGLEAVVLATRAIKLGDASVVVAGGMESMSRAPYALQRARSGYRMGHGELVDLMIHDGLWDPYGNIHMGNAAELCSRTHAIDREAQDAFAVESYRRALGSLKSAFAPEIAPVVIDERSGRRTIAEDEEPTRAKLDQIGALKPAFEVSGTVTAGNASKINDGASAVIVASGQAVREQGLTPLARIVSYGHHAQAPEWFTTAPVYATRNALERAGLRTQDIDLFEINEAFAVVCLACIKLGDIPREKVNVRGGAIALGHPIGASGARVLTTLVHALHSDNKRYGLATLCIGGGEAVAMVIEKC